MHTLSTKCALAFALVFGLAACDGLLWPGDESLRLEDREALEHLDAAAAISRIPTGQFLDSMRTDLVVRNTHADATVTWTVRSDCEVLVRLRDSTGTVVKDETVDAVCGESRSIELAPGTSATFAASGDLTGWAPGPYAAEVVMPILTEELDSDTTLAVQGDAEFVIPDIVRGLDVLEFLDATAWVEQHETYPQWLDGWIELYNPSEHRLTWETNRTCPFYYSLVDVEADTTVSQERIGGCSTLLPLIVQLEPGAVDTLTKHTVLDEGHGMDTPPGTYGARLLLYLPPHAVPVVTNGQVVADW